MSLSSLLLPKKAAVDTELDSLFKLPIAGPSKSMKKDVTKKRKLDAEKTQPPAVSPKRSKLETTEQIAHAEPVDVKSKNAKVKPVKSKASTKGKAKEIDSDEEEDEDDDRLENAYLGLKKAVVPEEPTDEEDDGDDEEKLPNNLVHESLTKKNKKTRVVKTKYIPSEETPEQREQRTIFVGNLPIAVASKKPLQKQLKHFILSSLPTAKIESMRFRSIPFQAPTAKLEDESDPSKKKLAEPVKKEPRLHEKERASTWRSKLDEKDEENVSKDEKKYLNPAQKKKIAFINHEFHSSADAVNAYVVFAHPPNTEKRPANLPPLPPTMDPYQAAVSAVEKCNGTMFMERMLRMDLVSKNNTRTTSAGGEDAASKAAILETDPRLSVFVGNLDFASKEEDLRVFFESLMVTEKGAPPFRNGEEDANKPATWVTRVRIVRDKDTLLGKGFAYVQFADRECVDELLALEQEKLKFAKRKLRVQRCKTTSGTKEVVTQRKERAAPAVIVPKGDPRLGEKLHGLPKEERKQIKSTDADRVARRLAKKKARMAMAPGVGKKNLPKGKDRKRAR